jgi:hypothetical protein
LERSSGVWTNFSLRRDDTVSLAGRSDRRVQIDCFLPRSLPWDETYYPRSMRNLPPEVRSKAIEIANALLEDGYNEGKVIRIAIAKAKEWVERGGGPQSR